jgi:predicted dehydrogenase
MIKTIIIGLGNIGIGYDLNKKNNAALTHVKSLVKNKKFKLVAGFDKSQDRINLFKKKFKIYAANNFFKYLKKNYVEFAIVSFEIKNIKTVVKLIEKSSLRFILFEKPFIFSSKQIVRLFKIKKDFNFTINFQRNFSKKYIELINRINNGLIGNSKNFKIYCYYSNNFFNNGTHLLNLILPIAGKLIDVKKISKDKNCFFAKFNYANVYFNSISNRNYNYNSLVIYGEKGKIEITSRPENCIISLKKKDNLYPNYFILKERNRIRLDDNFPQRSVLNSINSYLKNSRGIIYSKDYMLNYIKVINIIKKKI